MADTSEVEIGSQWLRARVLDTAFTSEPVPSWQAPGSHGVPLQARSGQSAGGVAEGDEGNQPRCAPSNTKAP